MTIPLSYLSGIGNMMKLFVLVLHHITQQY